MGAIAIGIGYCARSSPLRRVLTRGFAFGIAGAAFSALLPSLVRDRLHGTEIIYGLCLAAFGAGSIFAALWVGEARKRWGSDRVVSIASLVFAAAMVPAATALTLPPLLATAFVAGAAWVSTLTTLNVAMQPVSYTHLDVYKRQPPPPCPYQRPSTRKSPPINSVTPTANFR